MTHHLSLCYVRASPVDASDYLNKRASRSTADARICTVWYLWILGAVNERGGAARSPEQQRHELHPSGRAPGQQRLIVAERRPTSSHQALQFLHGVTGPANDIRGIVHHGRVLLELLFTFDS